MGLGLRSVHAAPPLRIKMLGMSWRLCLHLSAVVRSVQDTLR